MATRILRRHDYHVLETSNAGEALLTSELRGNFGGGAGNEQYAHLRALLDQPLREQVDWGRVQSINERSTYLQKPIEPTELVRRVREALDARERRSWLSVAGYREKVGRIQ
ncbi:MAG TPA: hypothetical protein VI197_22785 [Polyangiaceae bacterium]